MPASAWVKFIPRFSNPRKETSAATGVSRCMNRSDTAPVSNLLTHPYPTTGARKRNTVIIVTVTAAVPAYFSSQTHSGISPAI